MSNEKILTRVRADKWLWAARFFKTRNLAKTAIEGGKIHVDGQRIKPSKDIEINMRLSIRVGWDEKEVLVTGVSEQRRGAPEAALLYQETDASIEKRKLLAEQRKAMGAMDAHAQGKPNTKQRRQIQRIKRDILDM